MVTLDTNKSKRFSVHSIAVEIRGSAAENLAEDFDFFTDRPENSRPPKYTVSLELLNSKPDANKLPAQVADQIFSDCVLYRNGTSLLYDYHGAAQLHVIRKNRNSVGTLYCNDPALLEELGYLFLQSEIGRFLDDQGLHRVHGLGLGLNSGRSCLLLLPSGGGKSTLALELLGSDETVLLSDDTPLMDRFGNLYPLPCRMAFREGTELPANLSKGRVFNRRKFGAKILIPSSALPGKLPRPDDRFRPGYLVLGIRHGYRREPRFRRIKKWQGAVPLFRDLVVGIGIPQVAELILSKGLKSIPGLAPTGASRAAAATAYLTRAKVFALDLSNDAPKNAKCLLEGIMNEERD